MKRCRRRGLLALFRQNARVTFQWIGWTKTSCEGRHWRGTQEDRRTPTDAGTVWLSFASIAPHLPRYILLKALCDVCAGIAACIKKRKGDRQVKMAQRAHRCAGCPRGRASATSSSPQISSTMNPRARSRHRSSIGANQLSKRWAAISVAGLHGVVSVPALQRREIRG